MPLMSWAFECDGHPVRAEIGWHLSGRTRKRLYVDHRRVAARRGRFNWGRPFTADLTPGGPTIDVRFKPRRLGTAMACSVAVAGRPMAWSDAGVHRERRWQFDDDARSGPSLGCLIAFALLPVMCVLYAPLMIAGLATMRWVEFRHRGRMRRRGRLTSWADLARRGIGSPGTLILQVGEMDTMNIWWTADNVPAGWPVPRPSAETLFFPVRAGHPFIDWCWARYLSEPAGTAVLVDAPGTVRRLIDPWNETDPLEKCRREHPELAVVATGYVHGRKRRAAARRFEPVISRRPDGLASALVAALDDPDPAVRKLCQATCRLLGPSAADAVPVLRRQLFDGPWRDRHGAARALAAVGDVGLSVLRMAATVDDPEIASQAKSALYMATHSPDA